MSTAATIRRMLAAGLTIDQALTAVEAIEAQCEEREQEKVARRRAAGAARQRAYAARKRGDEPTDANDANDANDAADASVASERVICVSEPPSRVDINHACADGNPNSSLRSELLVTPLPSGDPQGGRSPSRGTALPDDWVPGEDLFAYGANLGLSREQTGEILEGMRLWAIANRNRAIARKSDWTATMQGALRKDAAKARQRAGPQQKHRTWTAALADSALKTELGDLHDPRRDDAWKERSHSKNVLALSVSSREGAGGNGTDDLCLSGDDEGFSFGNFLRRM